MSWFPQIGAGSVAQFPVSRSRRWRAIANRMESSELILLPDAAGGQIVWKLSYRDLVDSEVQNLSNLFTASQGGFGAFTFIDPLANLFGWSEDLSQSAWQVGLLQTATGVIDPLGTHRASSVTNPNPGCAVDRAVAGRIRRLCCVFQRLPEEQRGWYGCIASRRNNTHGERGSRVATRICEWQGCQRSGTIDLLPDCGARTDDRCLGLAGGGAAVPFSLQTNQRRPGDL